MTKRLIVSMYQVLEISRHLKAGGYKLQRVKRGQWIVSDNQGIVMPMQITTDVHPDKQLYYEELSS